VTPAFDLGTYIDRVLRPLGRGGSGRLPHLVVRYALDHWPPDATDEDLMTRVDQVVDLWRRQAEGGTAGLAETCRRCLAEDDKLRHQTAYSDPRWWRGRIRDWQSLGQSSDPESERASQSAGQAKEPSATAERGKPSAPEPPKSAAAGAPLALPPPVDLTAETTDDRVILRWQAPPGASADVRFTIERLNGTGDRQLVAATPGTTVEDPEPPGGRVTYRVRAEHVASGARSAATLVRVVFAPPVTDVVAGQIRDGRVVGHWRMHPDVWRVDVWRTLQGAPTDRSSSATIRAQARGFDDPQPPPGRYIYSITPLYRDPDIDQTYRGRRVEVGVEVFDRPPRPRISIGESREHESARVTFRWGELPDGMFLMLRCSAVEPAGAAGDLLMMEEVEQVGQLVWNGRGFTATTANMVLPAGRWVLVPFAVAGRRAVRGDCLNVDVVPPVTSPEAARNGPEVQVSWVWPNGLRLARVVWRAASVDLPPREITRSEFQGRGSVTFRRSEAASIRIIGIVRSGADELTSATVTVTVGAQPPTLSYRVRRIPSLPGLMPWSRRRRVILATDLPCVGLRAMIYAHPEAGDRGSYVELAARDNLDFVPGRSQVVTVAIPRVGELAGPCYLWCRATTGSGEVRVDNYFSRGRRIR
jgi:hypothetical protein